MVAIVQTLLRQLTDLPHRGAATANGAEAARRLESWLGRIGATVHTEPFRTPKSYVTNIYWLIGGLLIGLGLVPVTGVAVGLVWYFIVLAWRYFNWHYSFVIKFPVQHAAHNVIGRWPIRDGAGAVRKVILMAHYDTAPVSLLYRPKQQVSFRMSLIVSLGLMVLAGCAATLEVFRIGLPYLAYVRYGLMSYFVLQAIMGTAGYWLYGYTNGASDNATGVAAALATADRLRQINLPGLDLEVVLTSAEEAGMIGAYYYVEAHKREWNPAQTMVINFDTLGAGTLTVVEQTGTLDAIRYDNDPTRLARTLLETNAFKDRVQVGRWHTADFDSVWFVRNRIPVLALCALDADGRMPRIHQADDTIEAVELTPMYTAIELAEAVITTWLTSAHS